MSKLMPEAEINIEQRLIELESKVAFQEHIIDELNGVIISQQEQIDRIEQEFSVAHSQLKAVLSNLDDSDGI